MNTPLARIRGGVHTPVRHDSAVGHVTAVREAHPDTGVVLVSHGDVIKAIVAWCLGLPLDAHMRFDIAPASVSALVAWEGGAKLLSLNEVPG